MLGKEEGKKQGGRGKGRKKGKGKREREIEKKGRRTRDGEGEREWHCSTLPTRALTGLEEGKVDFDPIHYKKKNLLLLIFEDAGLISSSSCCVKILYIHCKRVCQ